MDSQSAGLAVQVSGATDRGQVRDNNGDSVWWRHEASDGSDAVVLAVADGMGGPAGEIASRAAINECRRSLIGEISPREAPRRLSDAVRAANARVHNLAQTSEEYAGMGASLAIALVLADRLYVEHVGDSHCYLVRSGACTRITAGQTPAAGEESPGQAEAADAGQEPARTVAYRAVGLEPEIEADILGPLELAAGDVVLLCSDGLAGVVSEEEIARAATGEPPERLVRTLISVANSAGGPDNISVLAARIGAAPAGLPEPAPAPDVSASEPDATAAPAGEPEGAAPPLRAESAADATAGTPGRSRSLAAFIGPVAAALIAGFGAGIGASALMDGGSGDQRSDTVAIITSPRPTQPATTTTPKPGAGTPTSARSRSPTPAGPTATASPVIVATTTCIDGETPAVELVASSGLWAVYDIANRYGLAEADLYECDPYLNPYAMYPGVTVVLIPCASETECPETGGQ